MDAVGDGPGSAWARASRIAGSAARVMRVWKENCILLILDFLVVMIDGRLCEVG